MLTEALVPLLSLNSKKGLVTIASKIYIFAHMLMPVSVFPHQGWHISRRKLPFLYAQILSFASKNPQQKEGK